LYYGGIGFLSIKYKVDASIGQVSSDKLLARWKFDSRRVLGKLAGGAKRNLAETLANCPVATAEDFPDAAEVLMPLPQNFAGLKKVDPAEATRIRLESRVILDEYINKRKYCIVDCVSGNDSGERKSFYVLARP
jgi:predicted GNAT superfamily acetyltransferase